MDSKKHTIPSQSQACFILKPTIKPILSQIRSSLNSKLTDAISHLRIESSSRLYWYRGLGDFKNFGDLIGPVLYEAISGGSPRYAEPSDYCPLTTFLSVGSIAERARRDSILWGTGLGIDERVRKPNKICAVRGPKTRECFQKQGIECPEVYGDPGLLLPLFFPRTHEPCSSHAPISIIPHVDDYKESVKRWQSIKDINIIDLRQDFHLVLKAIINSKTVLSSSLHGVIAAHAYGIPAGWVSIISDRVGKFKFYDYFESIDVNTPSRRPLRELDSPFNCLDKILVDPPNFKIKTLQTLLLSCCPFPNSIIKISNCDQTPK